MAKIVDFSQSERPTPRIARAGAVSPGEGPSDAAAKGLQSMGRDLVAGSEELHRAQKIEEDKVNTLRAEEAFNKVLEKRHELTYGEQGFTSMRGADAVSKPLLPDYTKKFEDAAREVASGLSNEDQKRLLTHRVGTARLQMQEEILRHQAQQRVVYGKEVYDGVVQTAQRDAAARWNVPNDVAGELVRVADAVQTRADAEGWPKEFKDAQLKTEQGKVHAAVIGQALATGSYRYAESWFNHYRKDMDLATSKALVQAVADGAQKERTNDYNREYLLNEDSRPFLSDLRKRVLSDDVLNEDRKNVLLGRIQNREHVLERRAEVAHEKQLRVLGKQIGELNASTLAGFEPNAEQFAPILAATKGTELEAEAQQAIALAGSTRAFRNAPPLVQERMLAESEAGVRTEPTKFDRRVVSAWRQIYDAQRRQAVDNPVSFAVQQGIVPPPQPLDLSQPKAMSEALAERFAIARGVASRYQTPFKPLTTAETELLTNFLGGATIEQKRNYFRDLSTATGQDTRGYMGIMAQLAPDQPVVAIAGSAAALGKRLESDLMLRGEAILRPSKKSDGKPDGSGLYPMPPEKDLRERFDSVVRDAFAGKAEARNAHYQAAKAIYAALSVDAGDRDTKLMDADRWEKAISMAIGNVERYQGRTVVLPHAVELPEFRDGLKRRIEDLVTSQRLDDSWTASRLRDMPVENIGDGRYVFKKGDSVVVDKSGKPVIVDFNLGTLMPEAGQDASPLTLQDLSRAR